MRTIALLPARCGSKGIVLKNIYPINNKPMIVYAIDSIKKAFIEDIYVSTDCKEIEEVAKKYNTKIIIRPKNLATDNSPTIECIKHCVSILELEPEDTIILVQPTSPMILPIDIINGINTFNSKAYGIVISVSENHNILWEEQNNYLVPKGHNPHIRIRRQNMKKTFTETGSFYIFKAHNIIQYNSIYGYGKVGYVTIPKSRSFDIDDYEDIKIVEALLNE